MLVPFAILAVDGRSLTPRTERYLLRGFDDIYGGRLSQLGAWREWVRAVVAVQPAALGAFEGKVNLHTAADKVLAVQQVYERLAAERAR